MVAFDLFLSSGPYHILRDNSKFDSIFNSDELDDRLDKETSLTSLDILFFPPSLQNTSFFYGSDRIACVRIL